MWFPLLALMGLLHPLRVASAEPGSFCALPDNSNPRSGVCINIRNCPVLLDLLKTQGIAAGAYIRRFHCGFEGTIALVCCPQNGRLINPDQDSDRKEVHQTSYGPLSPPECGFSNVSHTRVVGGMPAQLGAWPWATALGYTNKADPSKPRWLCGGALISRQHILTAAHCIRNDLYVVRIGDLNLFDDNDGAHPVERRVARYVVHPQYSSRDNVNDIAILKLENEVPFTAHIYPICLPTTDKLRNSDLARTYPFVAGWGSVDYQGPASAELQEVQIPVVREASCKQAFEKFAKAVIDDRVLCAGYAQGGKDACQGDSGGSLMLPQGKYFYAIGVVSYGYRCAQPGYPGVYTRVTEFLNFVTENLV